ncbi:hypothetical protein LPTSP4_34560 [Leptospira ryugenii]|uniref:Uncharacterized protein n=1 Tax=Leptospira ryugenii TaxID=1917863 RepID=A0A2P2E4W3_9LEPT|nr:hypothetical protein [Leptospira ryugenii]GBF51918.1 hypothetical protein LPTSP4_34560 [Leptospira ryugenii]
MKVFLIILTLFLVPGLKAKATETISTKEIFVGDTFEYNLTFPDSLPEQLIYPEGDFILEGEELPLFSVISAKKDSKNLSLELRFYEAGQFSLPVEWMESGNQKKSDLKLMIKSRLDGRESDIDPNEPPLLFSGTYWYRLVLVLLILFLSLYLIYSLYLMWKRRIKIVDATWQPVANLEKHVQLKNELDSYLNSPQLSSRQLTYLFTSYIKWEFSHKLQAKLHHLTDSEFLSYLYDHYGAEESNLRELRNFFREHKYTEFEIDLNQKDAQRLVASWIEKLKL